MARGAGQAAGTSGEIRTRQQGQGYKNTSAVRYCEMPGLRRRNASFPNEENFLEALKKEYKPNTLCHNDFVQGNILYSDTKDYLIDYEYAAKNDYRFDIASFFSENNIHYIDQRDQFYQTYFDGEIDPMIDVQVQAFERMEDILWGYWANMLYEQRGEQIYFDIAKDKEKHYRG